MQKRSAHTRCQCCNLVVMKTSRKHAKLHKNDRIQLTTSTTTTNTTTTTTNTNNTNQVIPKSSLDNVKLPFCPEVRRKSLFPKSKALPKTFLKSQKIHKIGPRTIYIRDPAKTYALSFSDSCFELVCGECCTCFRIMVQDSSICYMQEHEKVDFQQLPPNMRSLETDFPLQLRKYLNFDYNVFMYNENDEERNNDDVDSDNFQMNDDIIVGSFQQSSLMEFSHIDLFD